MKHHWLILALFPLALSAQEDAGAKVVRPPSAAEELEAPVLERYQPREYIEEIIEVERPVSRSESRPVAILRGLDKISGRVSEIRAAIGAPVVYERLSVEVMDCREPAADEASDAYAFVRIADEEKGGELFSGWMFASSPALSAMDHHRYDVWVLSCATS